MFECFSELQNVVNQSNARAGLLEEDEYYRLEFGCDKFKHISDLPEPVQSSIKLEPSFTRWKWWKY